MNRKFYHNAVTVLTILIFLVHLHIPRSVIAISAAESESSVGSSTVVSVETNHVRVSRLFGVASIAGDQSHSNTVLPPRADPTASEPSGNASSTSTNAADGDTTVAVSTIVSMAVLLVMFLSILICLSCMTDVDFFRVMKRAVYHPRSISVSRSTTRDDMSRTSAVNRSLVNTSRSSSPISGISRSSTLRAVPIKDIELPAPIPVRE